jgi:hypothetical protein
MLFWFGGTLLLGSNMNLTNISHYVWICVQDSVKNSAGKSLTSVQRSVWTSVWIFVRDSVQWSVWVSIRNSIMRQYEAK